MAQEARDNRILLNEDEARRKLLEGAKAVHDSVSTTYGPRGQNALLEKPFGRPMLTRDGVTVAKDTYFKDRAKNMGAQIFVEAAEVTNRIAGDGTSATVVFGYNVFKEGIKSIAAGNHPMQVKDQLIRDRDVLLDRLDELKTPIKKDQLKDVATVSSGDALLGQMIAEAVEYVGADGGIITEKSYVQDVEREYVDGYYLQTGFEALPVGKKDLIKPIVIVATRRIASGQDAVELINQAALKGGIQKGAIPRFLLIGNIEEAAYNTIVTNANQGVIDAVILKTPPQFGNMSRELLEDIAVYADCKPIDDESDLQDLDTVHIGSVDKVVASKTESTLFSDNKGETIQDRIAAIKSQIEQEIAEQVIEKLKDRVAKLEGKIALFKIGGATDTTKEEVEFRVEDAIQATRAAASSGVVAGGGITLLELSKCDISPVARKALHGTFKRLLENANLPAEVKLEEALNAPVGQGFNLRAEAELTDMVKAGILDPALVTEQTIKNSIAAAADALTVGVGLIFEDRKE